MSCFDRQPPCSTKARGPCSALVRCRSGYYLQPQTQPDLIRHRRMTRSANPPADCVLEPSTGGSQLRQVLFLEDGIGSEQLRAFVEAGLQAMGRLGTIERLLSNTTNRFKATLLAVDRLKAFLLDLRSCFSLEVDDITGTEQSQAESTRLLGVGSYQFASMEMPSR